MIIYSVTVSVEKEISEEWQAWMLASHIPAVMETGCFKSYTMQRLLEPISDETMDTFNMQYICSSRKTLDLYQLRFAPSLQQETSHKYGGKFLAFRSILERIGESKR